MCEQGVWATRDHYHHHTLFQQVPCAYSNNSTYVTHNKPLGKIYWAYKRHTTIVACKPGPVAAVKANNTRV
jgi:hypothetical protein